MRTVLVLLAFVSFLRTVPRLQRSGAVRWHIDKLNGITPIQQFAPASAVASLFTDPAGPFNVTIIAHRIRAGAPYELVPIDERPLAAWLA